MSNPYQNPTPEGNGLSTADPLTGPAIALMVVAGIGIGVGVLGLIGDAFIILSGTIDRLEELNRGPVSEYTTIIVRIIWGIVLLIASSFVFYGALKMKNRTDYGTAKAAAIIAMIPLISPCCLLGIPFGIWAFSVLNSPHVKASFR